MSDCEAPARQSWVLFQQVHAHTNGKRHAGTNGAKARRSGHTATLRTDQHSAIPLSLLPN